jgi:hypothetical protein
MALVITNFESWKKYILAPQLPPFLQMAPQTTNA